MFNDYVWQLYLNAGGREVASKFEDNLTKEFRASYADFIRGLHAVYCPSKDILDGVSDELKDLYKDLQNGIYLLGSGKYYIKTGLDCLYLLFEKLGARSDQDVFSRFSGSVAYFTTFLAVEIPELFVPYYFQFNFNVFQNISDEFDIDIPPIPQKKDYKGRLYYYGEICEVLLDFRKLHHLSSYELCAFLYDFAPRYIGGIESYIIRDLPRPESAYFIGGAANDQSLSDEPDIITSWQCSPDTHAGDMIVMYLRYPVSAVDSVWRSVCVGFNDPFFYYYRCTYIAHPVKLQQKVSLPLLKADKVFKDLSIVRKNMQGINGVELKPSEYNRLLKLGNADKSILRLKFSLPSAHQTFANEKDVENKLVKPLLKRLGYSEGVYVQQLYIEIGNHNHMLIPDFVLLPNRLRGHQTAFCVIEAKHSVTNGKELEEAKIQARSYAVQLRARYSAVISQEGLWLWTENDDFTDDIFKAEWKELKKADVFSALFKLIGKR